MNHRLTYNANVIAVSVYLIEALINPSLIGSLDLPWGLVFNGTVEVEPMFTAALATDNHGIHCPVV
jgi:hypothetical protein